MPGLPGGPQLRNMNGFNHPGTHGAKSDEQESGFASG